MPDSKFKTQDFKFRIKFFKIQMTGANICLAQTNIKTPWTNIKKGHSKVKNSCSNIRMSRFDIRKQESDTGISKVLPKNAINTKYFGRILAKSDAHHVTVIYNKHLSVEMKYVTTNWGATRSISMVFGKKSRQAYTPCCVKSSIFGLKQQWGFSRLSL